MQLLGNHVHMVGALASKLERLQDADPNEPNVVLLRGPSGSGKSRIVREFYDRLRASFEDKYWPELAASDQRSTNDGFGVDPMSQRKIIAPRLDDPNNTFVWGSGVLPHFAWWGLNCERHEHNGAHDVVSAMKPQELAHVPQYKHSLRKHAGAGYAVWAEARDHGKGIVEDFGEDGVTALLNPDAAEFLDEFGIPLKIARKGLKFVHDEYSYRNELKKEKDLTESAVNVTRSAGSELAKLIVRYAHPNLPAILVIEDMHRMGSDVEELVGSLIKAPLERPVLVIGTVWPESFARGVFADWYDANKDYVDVWDVEPLPQGDLVEFVRHYAPETSRDIAEAVAERLPNPFMIQLWLTLDYVTRAIRKNSGAVSQGLLEKLEGDSRVDEEPIRALLKQRWSELSRPVQLGMMLAAVTTPLDSDPVATFPADLVEELLSRDLEESSAYEGIGVTVTEATDFRQVAEDALLEACDPANWCKNTDDVQSFTEEILAEIARKAGQTRYQGELHDLAESGLDLCVQWVVRQHWDTDPATNDTNVLMARWLVAFADKVDTSNYPPENMDMLTSARRQALWLLALAEEENFDYRKAISFAEEAIELTDSTFVSGKMMLRMAMWYGELGYEGERLTLAEDALSQVEADDRIRLRRTVAFRNAVATLMDYAEESSRAAELYARSLADMSTRHGFAAGYHLAVRQRWINSRINSSEIDGVIDDYKQLVAAAPEVYGPVSSETIAMRKAAALAYRTVGDSQLAIDELKALIPLAAELFGQGSATVLSLYDDVASTLRESRRIDEAIDVVREALCVAPEETSEDRVKRLRLRVQIGELLTDGHRFDEAEAVLDGVLQDAIGELGPDHPVVLDVRKELCSVYYLGRKRDVLAPALKSLRDDIARIYGQKSTQAYDAQYLLVAYLIHPNAFGADELISEGKALVALAEHVYGVGSSRVYEAEGQLALCYGDERIDAAIEMFQDLVARRESYTQTHPSEAATRGVENSKARLEMLLDTKEEMDTRSAKLDEYQDLKARYGDNAVETMRALREYLTMCDSDLVTEEYLRELMARQKQVLGAEHIETIETMEALAERLVYRGTITHPEESVAKGGFDLFGEALRLREETMGPAHPDTFKAARNVDFNLSEDMRREEAAELREKYYRLSLEANGPADKETIHWRRFMAVNYFDRGKIDEGIAIMEALIEEVTPALDNDPELLEDLKNHLAVWRPKM